MAAMTGEREVRRRVAVAAEVPLLVVGTVSELLEEGSPMAAVAAERARGSLLGGFLWHVKSLYSQFGPIAARYHDKASEGGGNEPDEALCLSLRIW